MFKKLAFLLLFVYVFGKSSKNKELNTSNIATKNTAEDSIDFDRFLQLTRFNRKLIAKLRRIYNWSCLQKKRLKIKSTDTLIYPFGGGDILYPLVLFSDIHNIVIIGLEPSGTSIKPQEKLSGMNFNLGVLYEFGYFRTREMEKISSIGILTLMFHQLKALNAASIKHVGFNKGFELTFFLNGISKKIVYYSMNLNDDHESFWKERLEKYQHFTVFLKAGSYLLQQKNFDKIKFFLTQRAYAILQDDAGFAYQYLLNNDFKVRLYGYYWEPLQSDDNFHIFFQRSLMLAYLELDEDVNVFDISYNDPNWLWAINIVFSVEDKT